MTYADLQTEIDACYIGVSRIELREYPVYTLLNLTASR